MRAARLGRLGTGEEVVVVSPSFVRCWTACVDVADAAVKASIAEVKATIIPTKYIPED